MTNPNQLETFGSLFSGVGGLDQGVLAAFPQLRMQWVCEIEPGPKRVLETHYPGIPNLGDITQVDWSTVKPVQVLAGGSPCQDISQAGAKRGMQEDTRSGLWFAMLRGIRAIQPKVVVWENVKGALSSEASSDTSWLEQRVDGRPEHLKPRREIHRPLRALGRVLGDLHAAGYCAAWVTMSAAAVGAPHLRERVFVLAWRVECQPGQIFDNCEAIGLDGTLSSPIAQWNPSKDLWVIHPRSQASKRRTVTRLESQGVYDRALPKNGLVTDDGSMHAIAHGIDVRKYASLIDYSSAEQVALLPTAPASDDMRGGSSDPHLQRNQGHEASLEDMACHDLQHVEPDRTPLLPTPRASDAFSTPGAPSANAHVESGFGSLGEVLGYLASHSESAALLPTPKASDDVMGMPRTSGRDISRSTHLATRLSYDTPRSPDANFGKYSLAICGWEKRTGISVPDPFQPTRTGGRKLNPQFSEWMMGLTPGWVTDTGIGRGPALKACGNGVVPIQAAYALGVLLSWVQRDWSCPTTKP